MLTPSSHATSVSAASKPRSTKIRVDAGSCFHIDIPSLACSAYSFAPNGMCVFASHFYLRGRHPTIPRQPLPMGSRSPLPCRVLDALEACPRFGHMGVESRGTGCCTAVNYMVTWRCE